MAGLEAPPRHKERRSPQNLASPLGRGTFDSEQGALTAGWLEALRGQRNAAQSQK